MEGYVSEGWEAMEALGGFGRLGGYEQVENGIFTWEKLEKIWK